MEKTQEGAREAALDFLEPWNAQDIPAIEAAITDDFVWEFTVGDSPWGARFEGRAAVADALREIYRRIPDINYELIEANSCPGALIIEVRVTGFDNKNQKHLDYNACDIVIYEGDRAKAKRSYRKVVTSAMGGGRNVAR